MQKKRILALLLAFCLCLTLLPAAALADDEAAAGEGTGGSDAITFSVTYDGSKGVVEYDNAVLASGAATEYVVGDLLTMTLDTTNAYDASQETGKKAIPEADQVTPSIYVKLGDAYVVSAGAVTEAGTAAGVNYNNGTLTVDTNSASSPVDLKLFWTMQEYIYENFGATTAFPVLVEYTAAGGLVSVTEVPAEQTYSNGSGGTKVRLAADAASLTFTWDQEAAMDGISYSAANSSTMNTVDMTTVTGASYTLTLDPSVITEETTSAVYHVSFQFGHDEPAPDPISLGVRSGDAVPTYSEGAFTFEGGKAAVAFLDGEDEATAYAGEPEAIENELDLGNVPEGAVKVQVTLTPDEGKVGTVLADGATLTLTENVAVYALSSLAEDKNHLILDITFADEETPEPAKVYPDDITVSVTVDGPEAATFDVRFNDETFQGVSELASASAKGYATGEEKNLLAIRPAEGYEISAVAINGEDVSVETEAEDGTLTYDLDPAASYTVAITVAIDDPTEVTTEVESEKVTKAEVEIDQEEAEDGPITWADVLEDETVTAVELSIEDAALEDEAKEAFEEAAADSGVTGATVAFAVDITLEVTTDDGENAPETEQVTETAKPITITLTVPESDREYVVVRAHEDQGDVTYDVLDSTYDPIASTLTFKTDKFSTYAVLQSTAISKIALTAEDLRPVTGQAPVTQAVIATEGVEDATVKENPAEPENPENPENPGDEENGGNGENTENGGNTDNGENTENSGNTDNGENTGSGENTENGNENLEPGGNTDDNGAQGVDDDPSEGGDDPAETVTATITWEGLSADSEAVEPVGDTFGDADAYLANIALKAADGLTLTEDTVVTLNGEVQENTLFDEETGILTVGVAYVHVTAATVTGGTVEVGESYALVGEEIDVTATPDKDYEFTKWVVTAEGEDASSAIKDGVLTVPEALGVEVSAVFTKKAPVTPDPEDNKDDVETSPINNYAPAGHFTDVPNSWYRSAVYYCYDQGYFNGVSSTKFDPNGEMTRAMFATVLHRIAGEPAASGSIPFSDVPAGKWYTEGIRWATSAGHIHGYGNGKFGTEDPITREQLITLLWRYSGSPKVDFDLSRFLDGDDVSAWAEDAMKWAASLMIIDGGSDNMIRAKDTATRAEVAVIVTYFDEKVG